MNSRERVVGALNHQEPDQVPIDLGATMCSSITRVAYTNLRAYLGWAPDPDAEISCRLMQSVYPKEDLLLRYAVDLRSVHMNAPRNFRDREMPDDSYYDEYQIRWRKAAYYYDAVERPLADATIADLAHAAWPDPYDAGRVAGLEEQVRGVFESTDYAVSADMICSGPFEQACRVRGDEQFCVDLLWDPKFAEALLDKILETDIALWDVYLSSVGKYVQVVAQGDDVAMQTATYISPAMYRKFIKPRQRRLFEFIHSKTTAKIFYHCCGSVYDIIPDLIEIGVDALNPVQRSAAKMDISILKREFGKDITFWGGGIDTQQLLPFATLQQIDDEVRRTMEIMAPGGGFVFVPSHNIQPDVTPDRIDQVYQSALKYRHYR